MFWLLVGFLVLGSFINTWDAFYYPNYFYSHFNITPERVNVIIAIVTTAIIGYKYKPKSYSGSLLLISSLICLSSLYQISGKAVGTTLRVYREGPKYSDNLLVSAYGKKYEFIQWVKSVTPKDSRILIPPDTLPWRHTGSTDLMHSWLYPRQVYTASYGWVLGPQSLSSFDYILISSESDGNRQATWPDFDLPASKIIIYNWENQSDQTFSNINYRYDDWQKSQPWGLIVQKPL